jgi:hypothetical protein
LSWLDLTGLDLSWEIIKMVKNGLTFATEIGLIRFISIVFTQDLSSSSSSSSSYHL